MIVSTRALRMGQADLTAAQEQVTAIYQRVLGRAPTASELATAAQAMLAGFLTPPALEDALARRPYLPWKWILWGGGGLAALWVLALLSKRS